MARDNKKRYGKIGKKAVIPPVVLDIHNSTLGISSVTQPVEIPVKDKEN